MPPQALYLKHLTPRVAPYHLTARLLSPELNATGLSSTCSVLFWTRLNAQEKQEVVERRRDLDSFVEVSRSLPILAEEGSGSGIVIVAGGPKYRTNAFLAISSVRRQSSTLSVEVWYDGAQEMTPEWRDRLKRLKKVTFRDLKSELLSARVKHPGLPDVPEARGGTTQPVILS